MPSVAGTDWADRLDDVVYCGLNSVDEGTTQLGRRFLSLTLSGDVEAHLINCD